MLHFFINLDQWNALPKAYQSIVTTAAAMANVDMQAHYDAVNPGALAGNDVFFERVETLIAAMTEDPAVRLPGDRRLANRARAAREGVSVPAELLAKIGALAGQADPVKASGR